MKKKRISKKLFITIISIYILLFTTIFSINTYARYKHLLNGNGNLNIAKWDITVAGNDNQTLPTMVIGDSSTYQNYNFSITSISEISSVYCITLNNVPTGMEVQVDDNTTYQENNNTITINNLGSFNINDVNTTHTHKLSFIAPLGINAINNQTININVTISQVDL